MKRNAAFFLAGVKPSLIKALWFAGILTAVLIACASGAPAGGGAGISARGAIGHFAQTASAPMYEGDGGKDIRLAILAPEILGDAPDYLPLYVQGLLNNNFGKYSAITLIDRQNLDKIIAEQNLASNMRFSDKDFVRIGNLTNAQYFLFGTIQKMSNNLYSLNLSISGSSSGEIKAVFLQQGTQSQIENGALINNASADMLTQIGVRLTEAGRQSLLAGNTAVVQAQTGLAKGITAQAGGESVEALFNFTQAAALAPVGGADPSQLEALARLSQLSSSISGGSLSERILNDIEARDRWLLVFKETARFFNEHPPFEITFDPALIQEGETNYAKRTANLAMRVALSPSEAGFAALLALVAGLEKTGRRSVWGFDGWPLQDINPKDAGAVVFGGKRSMSFQLEIELLNDRGKLLSKSSVTLFSGFTPFLQGSPAPPAGAFTFARFPNVKADNLTPALTISITAVNGISARKLNETGYMKIDTGNLEEKSDIYTRLEYYNEDYDMAIADFTQAVKLNSNDVSLKKDLALLYAVRGDVYYYEEDYNKAIADYTQSIKLNPDESYAFYSRGLSYYLRNDYDRAITDYTQALRLSPEEAYIYNFRGNAYYTKGNYDKAIADYSQAIHLDPNYAWAYSNRGGAYQQKRDYISARADLTKALELDPSNEIARDNLNALGDRGK